MARQIVVYLYHRILLANKKQTIDTEYLNECQRNYAKWEKSV